MKIPTSLRFGPRRVRLWAAVPTVCLTLCLVQATSLRPMNLQEIVQYSSRIFSGVCLSAVDGVDSRGLPYSLYTFRIAEAIRGRFEGDTVTVKQFGLRKLPGRAGLNGKLTHVDGMPDYQPGATYLLFLNNESRWGFSAPIGLLQGAFRVLGDDGAQRVVNGIGNRNLLIDSSQTPAQRLAQRQQALRGRSGGVEALNGPVDYRSLTAMVQRMALGETIGLGELRRALTSGGASR